MFDLDAIRKSILGEVQRVGQGLVGKAPQQVKNITFDITAPRTARGIGSSQSFNQSSKSFNIPQVPNYLNPTVKVGAGPVQIPVKPVQLLRDIVNMPASYAANTLSDVAQTFNRTVSGQGPIQYQNLKSAPIRLGYNIGSAVNPQSGRSLGVVNTTQQILGNAAGTIEGPLSVYGGGKLFGFGKNAVQIAEQGFKQAVIGGIRQGAAFGGAYGVVTGLKEGREDTLSGQLLKAGQYGLGGAAAGGVLGGGLAGASSIFNKLRVHSKYSPAVVKELNEKAAVQPRDPVTQQFVSTNLKKPKGMTEAQWKYQLDFNKRYNRNPYQPVYQSDLKKAVDYEIEKRGVGLSVRDINKDKNPLNESQPIQIKVQGQPLQSGVTNPIQGDLQPNQMPQNQQLNELVNPSSKSVAQEISSRKGMSSPPQKNSSILSKQSQQIQETLSGTPTKASSLESIIPNSENPYFNTNKLNVSNKAKKQVNQVIQDVKPQIEAVVGKKLTNKEVVANANQTAKVLHSVVDRKQTLAYETSLLQARQKLAAAAKSGTVDQSYIDTLMTVKSHATDIARKLQSFGIGADPKLVTSKQAILEAVLKVEKNTSKVLTAAKGVDFNDLKQSTDFYRKFIKPTTGEWIDTIRYNSMLSSPNTHINNFASNAVNTSIIAPIEKTLTGTLDFLGSQVTGKPQKQFAAEGAVYTKGYVKSFHEAAHAFADVMRGKTITENLDVRMIPLSTSKRMSRLTIPTRLLEASDQFFTALTKGGETAALKYRASKGVKVGNLSEKALDNAKYRLFRSELHDPRQGAVLNAIDDFTGLVQKARSSDNPITSTIAKFTLPFVRTPMNILKQGIEYGPAGVLTIPGAANKTEQLSKAILGSSAVAATAMLVTSGRTTWAEPVSPTKRAAFRAAGLQPYAVKIGNNWVSYAKLPPALGFPIAFMSAIHDAEQNKTIDQNQADVIMTAVAKFGNFYADQSYLKNIGDLVTAAKGSPEAMSRFISNYPQQLVPYRALLGWMARLIDPYQRKVNQDAGFLEKQVQQLLTQIPGLSQTVPARLDASEQPIPNQNREINAFSPARITTERPYEKQLYDLSNQKTLNTKNLNIIKEQIKQGKDVTLPQAGASEGLIPTSQTEKLKAKYKDEILKTQVETSGKSAFDSKGNLIYVNRNGNAATFEIAPQTKGEGIKAFVNTDWKEKQAAKLWNTEGIDQETKTQILKKWGIDPEDAEYAALTSFNSDISAQYIESKSPDHETLLQNIISGRVVGITGTQFADNGTIDKLVESGQLSKDEATYLKKVKLVREGGKLVQKLTGRVAKGKKLNIAGLKKPVGKLKLKTYNTPTVKLSTKSPKVSLPKIAFNTQFTPTGAIPQAPEFKTRVKFNL